MQVLFQGYPVARLLDDGLAWLDTPAGNDCSRAVSKGYLARHEATLHWTQEGAAKLEEYRSLRALAGSAKTITARRGYARQAALILKELFGK